MRMKSKPLNSSVMRSPPSVTRCSIAVQTEEFTSANILSMGLAIC